MNKHTILYRGGLKSCNYDCSYCPFSKCKESRKELERDKSQWERFQASLYEKAVPLQIGALMVVPYGEALRHPWYWEGLARLSALDQMEAVGAQTNLSFPVEETLKSFRRAGGQVDKLRLWVTFHPEMVSVDEFAKNCIKLHQAGISFCAGAVAVPENLELLGRLKDALPKDVYFWLNQMDGRKRPYTEAQWESFSKIDPYFVRERTYPKSDADMCRGRLLVEGDGTMHTCNIGPSQQTNWYQCSQVFPPPQCGRRICRCYLAYGGRWDFMNRILFGEYPIFRIPRRPKAVFLDIDKTLIDGQTKRVSQQMVTNLTALDNGGADLFFATSLPYSKAMERCRKIRHFFHGGVFAGGAHVLLEKGGERREMYVHFEAPLMPYLKVHKEKYGFRMLAYRNQGKVYKATLLRSAHRPWERWEAEEMWRALPEGMRKFFRYFMEDHCLQIVSAKADKANGVALLCRWMGISPSEAAAAGDSGEDEGMRRLCSGVWV